MIANGFLYHFTNRNCEDFTENFNVGYRLWTALPKLAFNKISVSRL